MQKIYTFFSSCFTIYVVLLQLSILTTCLLCLYFSRAKHRATSHEDALTTTTSRSLPSHRTSTPLYHDNLGFR